MHASAIGDIWNSQLSAADLTWEGYIFGHAIDREYFVILRWSVMIDHDGDLDDDDYGLW